MKVLVTGGAGFIASHLVEALLKRGLEVAVLDNFSTGSRKNLKHLMTEDANLKIYEGDILDDEDLVDTLNGSEYIFHLAAIRSVPRSVREPVKVHQANATGTLKVLEAARANSVHRVIYAGSSSEYGADGSGPVSPYAASKMAGTNYCRAYAAVYGLQTITLRYYNVFGSKQSPYSQYAAVVPKFIDLIMKGLPLPIHGDGEQEKDFTHVDNIVHANLLAMDMEKSCGEIVNIGCGQSYSVLDVAHTIAKALSVKDVQFMNVDARPGDVRYSCADLSSAEKIFGYKPQIYFEAGIRKTVKWCRTKEGEEWIKSQADR